MHKLSPIANCKYIFACTMQVTFYPGRYATEKGSILPVGDPTQYIPAAEVRLLDR